MRARVLFLGWIPSEPATELREQARSQLDRTVARGPERSGQFLVERFRER